MARKGGYEVLEVDEFVDEVEESFAQLVEENASLKKQVDALGSGSDQRQPGTTAGLPAASDEPAAAVTTVRPAEPAQPAPVATGAPAPELEHVVVTTSAEASTAVVRLVQLSTEQAEHLVREAHLEAGRIREDAQRDAQQVSEDARTRAERLESEARVNAERLQAETQSRSESLEQELGQRRTELFTDLDRQHHSLTETVARLRDFEQRYRSSLQEHLQGQLTTLERVGIEPEGGPERTAARQPSGPVEQGTSAPVAAASAPDAGVREIDDTQPGASTAPSDTPRLDALLGEQR